MEYYLANKLAKHYLELLAPHCDKIAVSGDLARKRSQVESVEIVAIPKFYDNGLFKTGIATVLEELKPVEGSLGEFKVIREINEAINLKFYSCGQYNYGYILAWCNSPDDYRKHIVKNWTKKGYKGSNDQHLMLNGGRVHIPDEQNFFQRIGMPYIEPEMR